jgi:hypothetical protein
VFHDGQELVGTARGFELDAVALNFAGVERPARARLVAPRASVRTFQLGDDAEAEALKAQGVPSTAVHAAVAQRDLARSRRIGDYSPSARWRSRGSGAPR